MKLSGRKPSLTVAQSERVRAAAQRRAEIYAQINALKAELKSIPTSADFAKELGVKRATIWHHASGRSSKHHRFEARKRPTTQEQPQC